MITWKITSMESQPNTGIVISATWVCIGEENGYTSSMSGTSVFPQPETEYIPYENLSEKDVLTWVWIDGGVDKDIVETSVNTSVVNIMNPKSIINPLPWSN